MVRQRGGHASANDAEHRLASFNADREQLLAEVERRVQRRLVDRAAAGGEFSLEYVLNDVAFSELRRLGDSDGADRWRDLARRLGTMGEAAKRRELATLIAYYGRDIVGSFDARVYRAITTIGPSLLGFWFSPINSLQTGIEACLLYTSPSPRD